MEWVALACGLVLGAGVIYAYWKWRLWRSRRILARWVARNGYTLLSAEYRFLGGRFDVTSADWQAFQGRAEFFDIRIRDEAGNERNGTIRCGGWRGLLSDDVGVVWEKPVTFRCPKCNGLNDAVAKFCNHCGTAISANHLIEKPPPVD